MGVNMFTFQPNVVGSPTGRAQPTCERNTMVPLDVLEFRVTICLALERNWLCILGLLIPHLHSIPTLKSRANRWGESTTGLLNQLLSFLIGSRSEPFIREANTEKFRKPSLAQQLANQPQSHFKIFPKLLR